MIFKRQNETSKKLVKSQRVMNNKVNNLRFSREIVVVITQCSYFNVNGENEDEKESSEVEQRLYEESFSKQGAAASVTFTVMQLMKNRQILNDSHILLKIDSFLVYITSFKPILNRKSYLNRREKLKSES